MRSFLTFKIVLFSFLLVIASCGHSSSDESSDDNNNDKEEHLDCSTETKMGSSSDATLDGDEDGDGTNSEDDGSLDFDNLDDGTYSATVSYYNQETGFSNSYDLDVEVENNEVVQIDFPNGGYLTASETVNSDGTCTVTDDRGCTYEVQIEEQE
ncbi:hypothetical protein LPYR103PRE_23780 [Segatella asaccharophila]